MVWLFEWEAPSAEDCEEVYHLLAEIHGEAKIKGLL
jgi:hypothetical protein